MQFDLAQVATYVRNLTGSTLTPMTWQVFDDDPQRRDQSRAAIYHGGLSQVAYTLGFANNEGCGVFATVAETDLRGRRSANIRAVRALYIDTDGFIPSAFHAAPTMVVRSFAGVHAYWRLTDELPLDQFRDAQKRLIAHYRSDPKIHNLDRVMRVPGFWHRKGEPFAVHIVESDGPSYTAAQVLADVAPLPKVQRKLREHSLAGINWDVLDVVQIFGQAGFMPRDLGNGKWAVVCPWTGEHTHPDYDGRSTSTVIWERTANGPATFYCAHAHCEGRKLADALALLGYRPTEADLLKSRIRSARVLYDRTVAEQGGAR